MTGIKPPLLRCKPELDGDCIDIVNAFSILSNYRGYISTMADVIPTKIPYDVIVLFMNENNLKDIDARQTFMDMIISLDNHYIEKHYRKMQAKPKQLKR